MGRKAGRARRAFLVTFSVAFLIVNGLGWVLVGARDRLPGPALPALAVAAALPTEGVSETDQLVIVFDGPVVSRLPLLPPGSGEQPLPEVESAPFEIQPALSGRWRWLAPERLAFDLDEPLAIGRVVMMRPTPALEELAGRPVAIDCHPRWETRPLGAVGASVSSADDQHVTIEVEFNTEVTARAFAASVSLAAGDRELAVEPLTGESGTHHLLRIERPDTGQVELTLAVGLLPDGGELGLPAERRFQLHLPSRFELTGTRAYSHSNSPRSSVHLYFDRALASGQESVPVTVTPAVAPIGVRVRGSQVVIEGAFTCGERYAFEVGSSLLSADGESLGRVRRLEVQIPDRSSQLTIPVDEGVLSPEGGLQLELVTTNIPGVRIAASRVLPGNLVAHLRGERAAYTSREVRSGVFPLGLSPNEIQRHVIDLGSLLGGDSGDARGVYSINVRSTDDRWDRDRALVRVSDLVPTVKRDADGYHVWVRTLSGGTSVEGARLSVLSIKDQLLASTASDIDGYGFLPIPAGSSGGKGGARNGAGKAFAVLVEHGGDLGFVDLTGRRWSVPAQIASGRERSDLADVFVYPERGLYRPGDTVHLTGITRDPRGLVFTRALELEVERPDGRVMLKVAVQGDPGQGFFHVDLPTAGDARTGHWQVRVRDPQSGALVGRARFSVEAFLPARIVAKARRGAGEGNGHPRTSVTARALAGTSTEGFRSVLQARWEPKDFVSAHLGAFSFKRLKDERRVQRASWEGQLDAEGACEAAVPGVASLEPGLWSGRAHWTVTEPGSRSATDQVSVTADTAPYHLGLALWTSAAEGDRAGTPQRITRVPLAGRSVVVGINEPFDAGFVALNPGDTPVDAGRLWLSLERLEFQRELGSVGGRTTWSWREVIHGVWNGPVVAPSGPGFETLKVSIPGTYRLTLHDDDGGPVSALRFYATASDRRSFRPPAEDRSAVEVLPRESRVLPGEALEVLVRAPFDGSLLLTLEDDRLRWHTRASVEGGSVVVQVPLPDDLRGSVILSAQVSRALDHRVADWSPHRSHGWARLDVEHRSQQLGVAIGAPERVRPGSAVRVTVRVSESALARANGDRAGAASSHGLRPAAVHLWAVDEGIRVAGGDRAPQPWAHFFAPLVHSTPTTDGWFDLLPDHRLPQSVGRIGGDAEGSGAARRRSPESVHRIPGVVWLEAIPLDEEGRATFDVLVPEFTGELTWLAVAVDGDHYGSTQASTRLAGEVPLSVSVPRFAAPGDRFSVPLRFENQTDETADVTPTLVLAGPASVQTLAAPARALAPGESAVQWFDVLATGSGRITGHARLGGAFEGGRSVEELASIDLPVRSGRPIVVRTHMLNVDAGPADRGTESFDLASLMGLDAGGLTGAAELGGARVQVSASQSIDLVPAGRYLSGYPYGCAEQTGSRIMALLALPALAVPGGPGTSGDDSEDLARLVSERVASGIHRLWSMQTADGGIGYWPGKRRASPWASVYVGEILLACEHTGHGAPKEMSHRLGAYLEGLLKEVREPSARGLIVPVLARLGRPQPGWASRLEEDPQALGVAGRAAMGEWLASSGQSARARRLLEWVEPADPKAPGEVAPAAHRGMDMGLLGSDTRVRALTLLAYLQLDPRGVRVVELARQLEDERDAGGGRWRNTLDNACALQALSLYRETLEADPSNWEGQLSMGDLLFAIDSTAPRAFELPALDTPLEVNLRGQGRAYLTATLAGRVGRNEPAKDRGLVVRRRWLTGAGTEVDPSQVRLGDLIYAEITLRRDGPRDVEGVVIVDPLPGGFEIENPRLLEGLPEMAEGLEDRSVPRRRLQPGTAERVEYLDDRVLIFTGAFERREVYRYCLRAVAVGEFEWAPVQAESMYAPEVSSVGGPTKSVAVQI